MALFIGLDVGECVASGAVIDGNGKILSESSLPLYEGSDLTERLSEIAESVVQGAKAVFSQICAIGVCGDDLLIDDGSLENIKNCLTNKFKVSVTLVKKWGAAALGEARFGAGKGYSDCVLLNIGEQVNGGIVAGGKLFGGSLFDGGQFGHMAVERGGHVCKCGRRGCLEVYCSSAALKAYTKWAMEEYTSSDMWKSRNHNTADETTAFEYMDTDRTAKEVIEKYMKYLACGVINIANVLRPQAIIIGGKIAAQGSRITVPLKQAMQTEMYRVRQGSPVEVVCARLGERARVLGAAAAAAEVVKGA